MTVKEQALSIVKRLGWSIFPLTIDHNDRACDGGGTNCKKLRFHSKNWSASSSSDLDEIQAWDWDSINAYGIDCGKSGIVVVDVDPGASWTQASSCIFTTGRGRHYVYSDIIGLHNRTHVDPWGIDVRGLGGLIVGPGSFHPHGEYAIDTLPETADALDPAPPGLIDVALSTPDRDESRDAGEVKELDALECIDRLAGVYRRMAEAKEGERNNTLNSLAGIAAGLWSRVPEAQRTGELDETHIQQQLLASVPNEDDPAQSLATFRSGWAFGLEHPATDREHERELAVDEIFSSSPIMRHIRIAAHSAGRAAMPTLCMVIGRVLAEVPPNVLLPGAQDGAIGMRASLNLALALTGNSGAGKTVTVSLSANLLGLDQSDIQRVAGSGEGLVQSFLQPDSANGGHKLIDDPRRLFVVDEIEQLAQVSSRQGATLGPNIRSMVTGTQVGSENAEASRRRNLPANTYRMVLAVGVQPAMSAALLNEQRNGLPQRFVWVRVADASIPPPGQRPEWPGPLDVRLPVFDFMGEEIIDYPQHIKEEIAWADWKRSQGEGDDSTSQLYLTRLKVAAGLSLLHGEMSISEYWWGVAGLIIEESERVQAECHAVLAAESAQRQVRAATSKARAEHEASAAVESEQLDKAAASLVTNILGRARNHDSPGPFGWAQVKPTHRLVKGLRTTDIVEHASDALEAEGIRVETRTARNKKIAYDFWVNDKV